MANDAITTDNLVGSIIEWNGEPAVVVEETATSMVVEMRDRMTDKVSKVTVPKIIPADTVIRNPHDASYELETELHSEMIEEDMPSTVDVLPLLEKIDAAGVPVINANIIRNFCYKTEFETLAWWEEKKDEIATTAGLLKKHAGTSEQLAVQAASEWNRAIIWALSYQCLESLAKLVRTLYEQAFSETFVNRMSANKVGDGLKDKAPLDELEAAREDVMSAIDAMAAESGLSPAALAAKFARQENTRRASKRVCFVPLAPLADCLNGMMPSMQRRFIEGLCDKLHPAGYSKKKADRSATAKRLIGGYNAARNPNGDTYVNANTGARLDERKARKTASSLFVEATELYSECAAQTYLGVETRQRIRHDGYRRSDFIGALAVAIAEGDMTFKDVVEDERYAYTDDEKEFIAEAVAYVEQHDELPDYLTPREEIGA